jgi:hypothetical protein
LIYLGCPDLIKVLRERPPTGEEWKALITVMPDVGQGEHSAWRRLNKKAIA